VGKKKADRFTFQLNRNSLQSSITEFFSLTLDRVNARVRCTPGPIYFEKRPARKAKTQDRGEPNLRSAVKT